MEREKSAGKILRELFMDLREELIEEKEEGDDEDVKRIKIKMQDVKRR